MAPFAEQQRLNIKVVVVLVLVLGLLGAAVGLGHQVRKRKVAEEALAKGLGAYAQGRWDRACAHLKFYLSKYPTDNNVLRRYGEANLKVRPIERDNIGAAIGAFRILVEKPNADPALFEELMKLYYKVGDYIECGYVADRRLTTAPDDQEATLWKAKAMLKTHRRKDAEDLLAELIQNAPEHVPAYVTMSELSLASYPDEPERALSWLDSCIDVNRMSSEARSRRGRFFDKIFLAPELAKYDYADAEALLQDDVRAMLLLAQGWIDVEQPDRADRILEQVDAQRGDLTERFGLDGDEFLLAMFEMYAQIARHQRDKSRQVEIADRGLLELAAHVRGRFLETAVELYLTAGAIDKARDAIDEYRQSLAASQSTDAGRGLRAIILAALVDLAEGNAFEAINLLEPLVQRDPKNRLVRPFLAQAYELTGQTRRSLRILEEQIEQWPRDVDIRTRLINAYIAQYRWADALRHVRRLEEDDSALIKLEPKLLILKTRAYATASDRTLEGDQARREMQRLLTALTDLIHKNPDRDEMLLLDAFIRTYMGERDTAIRQLNGVIRRTESDENRLLARMQLVELYTRDGNIDAAIEQCQTAVQEHPETSAPLIALHALYISNKQLDTAQKLLEDGIETLPDDEAIKATYALVQFFLRNDKRDRGRELLKVLAERRPSDVQPRLVLLTLNEVQEQEDVVKRLVTELQKIEGERGLRWRYEQAKHWLNTDQWRSKESQISELLHYCNENDPEWSAPVVAMGALYELTGKPSRAEDAYRQMINTNPNAIEVVDRLLRLLERQKRYVEVSEVLNRLPPSRAWGQHEVVSYIGVGKYDKAIEILEERVAGNPKDASSRVLLARLIYAQKRDMERSLSLLNEADELQPYMFSTLSSRIAVHYAAGTPESFAEAERLVNEELERIRAGQSKREPFPVQLLKAEFYAVTKPEEEAEKEFKLLIELSGFEAEGHAALGRFYDFKGRRADAVEAWGRGLEIDGDNVDLRRRLVNILIISQDDEDRVRGRAILKDLLELLPNDPELLFLRADSALTLGSSDSVEQARRSLERAVEIDPRYIEAQLRLIEIVREWEPTTTAQKVIERALGANPRNVLITMARASLEVEIGFVSRAIALMETVLAEHPRSVEGLNMVSSLKLREGKIDEAEQLNQRALDIDDQNEATLMGRASVLVAQDRLDEAVTFLEERRAAQAGAIGVRFDIMLMDLYRFQNRYEEGDAVLQEVEKRAPPGDNEVLHARLRWLASQKRFDEMLPLIENRSHHRLGEAALLHSAASMLSFGKEERFLKESLALFREYVTLRPQRIEGYLGVAQVSHELGDMEGVVAAYREALEIAPFHPQVLNNLAWVLAMELNDLQAALEHADKGVRRYRNDPHLLNTRGVVYYLQGRMDESLADLQACLALSDIAPRTQAVTLLYMGRIHHRKGLPEQARGAFEQALAIDVEHKVLDAKDRLELQQQVGAK